MAGDGPTNDGNAKSAFGLSYLTEEKDWSGRTTTYRDFSGKVVGTSREENGRKVYQSTSGRPTYNGNNSGGKSGDSGGK